jgi:hypothetical protein
VAVGKSSSAGLAGAAGVAGIWMTAGNVSVVRGAAGIGGAILGVKDRQASTNKTSNTHKRRMP